MSRSANAVYGEVVYVVREYFGPAADRFVARQIRNHLGKDPSQLHRQDLLSLIEWIGLAMALLSDDEKLVKECVVDLKELAENDAR